MLRAPAWVLLVSALCGCAQKVDFVASEGEDQGSRDAGLLFTDVHVAEACMAGSYLGEFWSSEGPFSFTGSIAFALQTRPGEDTLTIDPNSKLFGEDEASGASIVADVIGEGRCRSGDFDARLEAGTFQQEGGIAVQFEGVVKGTYLAEAVPGFFGDWSATVVGSNVGKGLWYAVYVPPRPAGP